ERMNLSAWNEVAGMDIVSGQNLRIEILDAIRPRQAMTDKNSVGRSHGPREFGEKIEVRLINLIRMTAVGGFHSLPEPVVQVRVALGDPLIGPLSQFVIAQQHVNLPGKLTLQSGQEIDGLV